MNTARKGTVNFWGIVSGTHGFVTAAYRFTTGIVTLNPAGNPIRLTIFPPTGFFDIGSPEKVEVVDLRGKDITIDWLE